MKRLLFNLRVGLLGLGVLASTALAQDAYPTRPLTFVVPYPPGGSNDVFARRVAKGLSEALGQPIVIDNRPGASGNIGTGQVAKAAPDGYTFAVVSSSMTTNAAIANNFANNLPFDAVKSFAPVAQFARGPFIAAVNVDVPVKNPADLVALLRAKPGKLNYGSSGLGSSNQFATEMFKAASNTFMVHVPYRGMGPAVTDLISGQVQLILASGPSLLPHIRSGRIRAVGITSATPSAIAPDLIPLASAAPGYEFALWWGLLAPAGTPPAIVERLNREVNKLITTPEMKAAFLQEGAEAAPLSPAQFAKVIADDVQRWKRVAKQQSIVAE